MNAFRLAFKNLLGAGLRTWLNVGVLSFTFVVIVFYNGMLDGWNRQAMDDTMAWEVAGGQLWHPDYDRYDPFTIQDAHAPVKGEILTAVRNGSLTPILIAQGAIFPEGRMMNIQVKGIDPEQKILKLPSALLKDQQVSLPAMIGNRMAKLARLKPGDQVIMQWRDRNGTFDAQEITIVEVFNSNVPAIDQGTIWIPLEKLRQMTNMPDEATLLVADETYSASDQEGWVFRNQAFLLKEFKEIMQSKKGGSMIIYGLLLAISLLAIFDTQVLSVFRRQREIGTYIALGMTRWQVVRIFTLEGGAHSILAIIVGAIWGIPVLLLVQKTGIPMPASTTEMGLSITDSIIPYYSLGMILISVLLVVISATIVSYIPASKISKMKPTEALKGKIQ
ncbi:MAG: FtsX-like permease family protein [Bacteroidales bacterium]